jgi:hypothetical protein
MLARALAPLLGDGTVIAIEAGALKKHVPRPLIEVAAPDEGGAIACEHADVVLIGGLGNASALSIARAAAACAKLVVFAVPTPRTGLKGLFGKMRRQRPVLLEELCEALLLAGLHHIEARELEGASGISVVWGRAR